MSYLFSQVYKDLGMRNKRRQRRLRNCQILFHDNKPPVAVNNDAADEIAPYDMRHVLWYCRNNWSIWVQAAHRELIRYQEELVARPNNRELTETVVHMEILYFRLVKV